MIYSILFYSISRIDPQAQSIDRGAERRQQARRDDAVLCAVRLLGSTACAGSRWRHYNKPSDKQSTA
eukprot:COSAG06_NODE_62690_length_264_cov_0.830303_1_plen_66_part_10